MTGKDLITKEMLESHDVNERMIDWFNENYPNGGEYQEILDKLCACDRFSDAEWLLDEIGRTIDILELDELVDVQRDICFAGSLFVNGNISVRNLRVGRTIDAMGYINVIENIETNGGIIANRNIVAGGYISSGLHISTGYDIKVGGYIEADSYIKSGASIESDEYIEAGWYIQAADYIESGEDCGIYAGLKMCPSKQEKYGYITAKRKPKNIICGY